MSRAATQQVVEVSPSTLSVADPKMKRYVNLEVNATRGSVDIIPNGDPNALGAFVIPNPSLLSHISTTVEDMVEQISDRMQEVAGFNLDHLTEDELHEIEAHVSLVVPMNTSAPLPAAASPGARAARIMQTIATDMEDSSSTSHARSGC